MITKITDAQDTAKELFDLLNKYGMKTEDVGCANDLTRQALRLGDLSDKLDKIPDIIRDLENMLNLADALASDLYIHKAEQDITADEDDDPELVEEYRTLTQLGVEEVLTPAQADRRAYVMAELGW